MPLKAHEIASVFSFGTIGTYNPQWDYGASYNKGCRKNMKDSVYGDVQTDTYEIKNDDGRRCPRSVIYFKTAESEGESLHPTQKPVNLLRYLILTYSNPGDTILDNTIGSGTTAVAALREKRHFIGFELNRDYYDIALRRIKLEQQQQTLF